MRRVLRGQDLQRILLSLLVVLSFFYLRWWHAGPAGWRNPLAPVAGLLALILLLQGRLRPRSIGDTLLLLTGSALLLGTLMTGRWRNPGTREPLALLQGLVYAYLTARAIGDSSDARRVYRISLLMAGALVLVALAQLLLYHTTGYFFTFQTGQFSGISPGRWTSCCGLVAVSSVYGDPRDFSVRLAGLWGLAWFGLWFGRKEPRWLRLVMGGIVVSGLGLILLNFTRAAVLAVGGVGFLGPILALYRRQALYGRLALAFVLLGGVALCFSPLLERILEVETRSPTLRIALWRQYFQHLGFWGAQIPFPETLSVHSLWLSFLFYGGVPAAVLWLFFVGYLWIGLAKASEDEEFSWFLVFLGGVATYLVAYGLFSGYGFAYLWIVLGVAAALRGQLRAKLHWT